ncbi:MAG: hypothetical protein ACRDNO_03985 [Trebonia sp.]
MVLPAHAAQQDSLSTSAVEGLGGDRVGSGDLQFADDAREEQRVNGTPGGQVGPGVLDAVRRHAGQCQARESCYLILVVPEHCGPGPQH